MVKPAGQKWLGGVKVHPAIVLGVVVAVILAIIGYRVETWSMENRPDLRWHLTEFAEGLPGYADFIGVVPYAGNRSNLETGMYLIPGNLSVETENPDEYYREVFELFICGNDREQLRVELEFEFDPAPIDTSVKISPMIVFDNTFARLIPVTLMAEFREKIQICTYLLTSEGVITGPIRCEWGIPSELRGAIPELGSTAYYGEFTEEENKRHFIATGVGLTDFKHVYDENPTEAQIGDPGFKTPLGTFVIPVNQSEFVPPETIINLPKTGYPSYTKPFASECLVICSGCCRNGWYCQPDDLAQYDESDPRCGNDFNVAFYLWDSRKNEIVDVVKMGEFNGYTTQYISDDYINIEHTNGLSSGEFIFIAFPTPNDTPIENIYTSFTVSDTKNYTWNFGPAEPVVIPYGRSVMSGGAVTSSFEDSLKRGGFVILNSDGSAGLLRQPEFYQPLELLSFLSPPVSNGGVDDLLNFLGPVPRDADCNAYAFSTNAGRIVIYDVDGNVLQSTPVSAHFIGNTTAHTVLSALEYRTYRAGNSPLVVLEEPNGTRRLNQLRCNSHYIANWKIFKAGMWGVFVLLVLFSTTSSYNYYSGKGIFSYSEIFRQLGSEKSARQSMPDFTLAHQASIYSAVFHEMGKFVSTVRAFTQRDYRLIAEIEEILANETPDLDEAKEILGQLKGRKRYDELTGEATAYLNTMEQARHGELRLVDLVNRTLTLNRNYLTRHNTTAVTEFDDIDITVPAASGIIIDSLLTNAVDAVEEKRVSESDKGFHGLISVTITSVENSTLIIFEDNGCEFIDSNGNPLPRENWESIFEPGYTTKPKEQGHGGLGLSISREFAQREGWTLVAQPSEKPEFTKKFILEIPS